MACAFAQLPIAAAHYCVETEEGAIPGCDPSYCPAGEAHDHTRIHDDGSQEQCQSQLGPNDGSCYYPTNDVQLPAAVCDLLGYSEGECSGQTRRNYQEALVILCVLS